MDASLLTPAELEAVDLAAKLAEKLSEVVGNGPTRAADLNELLPHLHVIQNAVWRKRRRVPTPVSSASWAAESRFKSASDRRERR